MSISLTALTATNPIGYLAALGTLDAASRQAPGRDVRLSWDEGIVPRARLHGVDDEGELIGQLDRDRAEWASSPILSSGPERAAVDDLKPAADGITAWAQQMDPTPVNRRDAYQFEALLAEFALSGTKGDAKPTALHFTAGQQRFLVAVRELQSEVSPDDLREALFGPWTYTSTHKTLGWDGRGERIYALRGFDPSGETRRGVPGADWLGFVGLTFFPVAKNGGAGRDQLVTACCTGSWKTGTMRWPVWSPAITVDVIRSLLRESSWAREPSRVREQRGVFRVFNAQIRRSDQGGYGSFGPTSELVPSQRGGSSR